MFLGCIKSNLIVAEISSLPPPVFKLDDEVEEWQSLLILFCVVIGCAKRVKTLNF